MPSRLSSENSSISASTPPAFERSTRTASASFEASACAAASSAGARRASSIERRDRAALRRRGTRRRCARAAAPARRRAGEPRERNRIRWTWGWGVAKAGKVRASQAGRRRSQDSSSRGALLWARRMAQPRRWRQTLQCSGQPRRAIAGRSWPSISSGGEHVVAPTSRRAFSVASVPVAAMRASRQAASHVRRRGNTITVITSFPKELTAAYQKAYEAKYPDDKLEILNKNTAAGIAFVREQPAGSRPEIFWASAPDAFEVLASSKLLQKTDARNPAVPDKIGNYPINDPEGLYFGQALAGYGIMWNTRYLAANKLPEPKEWADLANPVYFGHVAISSPSRSGTTPPHRRDDPPGRGLGQGLGADPRDRRQLRGHHRAQLRRARRRCERPVRRRPRDRFLGLAAKNSGLPVEFVYPSVTSIVPANIALVAGGRRRRPANASSSSR